jgi:NAD+ kinase
MTRFDTVGVVAHPERDCSAVFAAIREWATEHDMQVIALEGPSPRSAVGRRVLDDEFSASADLVIAAGGDGTILRALALAAPAGQPVLAVNVGHLGFLAEVEPIELPHALAAISAGNFSVEERLALGARVTSGDTAVIVNAFNDLLLSRVVGHGQAVFAASVGGELFARYVGDGLIVSTPTGSTAYSLSAGGPIVAPMTQAILLTPIAPNGVFDRSLVLAPTETLRIDILAGSAPVLLERDGRRLSDMPPGGCLEVSKSDEPGHLVRLGGMNFYGRARQKLRLADPPVFSEPDVP